MISGSYVDCFMFSICVFRLFLYTSVPELHYMWLLFPPICLVAINISASVLVRFPCNDRYYFPTITVNC